MGGQRRCRGWPYPRARRPRRHRCRTRIQWLCPPSRLAIPCTPEAPARRSASLWSTRSRRRGCRRCDTPAAAMAVLGSTERGRQRVSSEGARCSARNVRPSKVPASVPI